MSTPSCEPTTSTYDSRSFLFSFEASFTFCDWRPWVRSLYVNWVVVILLSYLLVVFGLKWFMQDRKPVELRGPLIAWNVFLAALSTLGAIRTSSELVSLLRAEGLQGSICHGGYHHGSAGFWTLVFVLSKVLEFVDTLFIVLRKRPLIFLHYYHHVETCWYALYSYSQLIPVSRWCIAINFSVHSLMYTYYALRAMGVRLPKGVSMSLTTLQCLQMFVCVAIITKACLSSCDQDHLALYAGLVQYVIYAGLFTHYFVQSYFSRGSTRAINGKKGLTNNNDSLKAD